MPEVTKKVAKSLELLKSFQHFADKGIYEMRDLDEAIHLLQEALDKLCEEAK